jgi:A/G-specific adenine glycosylase
VKEPATARRIWEEAARLARGSRPGDLNQALMELGATLCTPRAPHCDLCPWSVGCSAHRAGDAEQIPRKAPKTAIPSVRAVALLLLRGKRALVVRRPPGTLLGGFWELPGGELARGEKPVEALAARLRERTQLTVTALVPEGALSHVFTHRRLRVHLFRAVARPGRVRLEGYERHRWVSAAELAGLSTSVLTAKALRVLLPAWMRP